MSKSRSRENRSVTTFWMENYLKKAAQIQANKIDMTLTDFINRAVEFYLREGQRIDPELGQKLVLAELSEGINESGKFALQLAETSQIQKGLQARVSELEKQMEELANGEALIQIISFQISQKVEPLIYRLDSILNSLDVEE